MIGFVNKKYFDDEMVEKYPFYLILHNNVVYCDTLQEYDMLETILEKFILWQISRAKAKRERGKK